MYLRARKHT